MSNGAFGENFPYSNFHDLNMDWIIKIAKDFLDQYTHIQEVIANGEESLENLTTSGLTQLQEKADALEALLQAWYDTHSADIAQELATALQDIATDLSSALQDITTARNDSLDDITEFAGRKTQEIIESIPADYSQLSDDVSILLNNYSPELQMAFNAEYKTNEITPLTQYDSFSLSQNKITITTSGVTGDVNCGIITNRDFIQFDEQALYILAYTLPAFSQSYYALVVHSGNGKLFQVVINDTTIRTYDITLPFGTLPPPHISAYSENGIIYIKLMNGTTYPLDITTIPLAPNAPQLGNWTADDIRFGILNIGNGTKNLTYNGELRKVITNMETLLHTIPNDLFMYYNAEYEITDFTGLTEYDSVQVSEGAVTILNSSTSADENFCGVISKRAYMNFNEGGLYFIATALDPDDNTTRYCFAINPANGYVYSIEIGTLVATRYNDTTLSVGSDANNQLKAYIKNDKIYAYCKGALNVIDVTRFQLVPNDATKGNWSVNDIALGIANGMGTSKTLTFRNRQHMTSELEHETVYYALGDSLTAGSYSDEQGQGIATTDAPWAYPYQIGKAIGGTVHNLGFPGGSSAYIYANEVPNVGSDATLITLMTGTNDYTASSALGTYLSTDWNTLMGRIYTIVEELMTIAPNARIILLSPLNSAGDLSPSDKANNYRRGVPCSAGWTYDDLVEQMKLFANKYGIEFINCTSNSPVNTFNLLEMLKDYTHPTKEAYHQIAQYIYSQMF